MAWGWNGASAGPGVVVDGTGFTASRPDAGGGGLYAGLRGAAGRKKGRRYFEVEVDNASAAIGLASSGADMDSSLGSGVDPMQWGFGVQYGYIYYRDNNSNGSEDQGTGNTGTGVYGVLVDFDEHTVTWYKDGVEIVTEYALDMPVDTVLYPAASMGTGSTDFTINGAEPFQYPPAVTYVPWDKSDLALGSKVSGVMQINGSPVARTLKAFSFERLPYAVNNKPITESMSLGQTVSDGVTGEYEIILRDGFPREVFVVAFDDYGEEFEADASVAVNDRIHPTTPNGYVYECTGAGDLPSTEPGPWPTDPEAGSQSIGTASFEVKPFYRPQVHGPITPDSVEVAVVAQPFQKVSGLYSHAVMVKSDGTIAQWGNTSHLGSTPPAISNVVQAGVTERTALALMSDGSLHAWGNNFYGLQNVPSGAVGDVIQISCSHQNAGVLKSDGTVFVWGDNSQGQVSGTPVYDNVVQISAGRLFYLVLLDDGTVEGWGLSTSGQLNPPAGLSNVVQISASPTDYHCLALKADGTVVGWGNNNYGQRTIPAGLTDVVQVAAGNSYSYALKSDGTLVSWGRNHTGQRSTPGGLPPITQIQCDFLTTTAIGVDGSVHQWGYNPYGEGSTPPGLSALVPSDPFYYE